MHFRKMAGCSMKDRKMAKGEDDEREARSLLSALLMWSNLKTSRDPRSGRI